MRQTAKLNAISTLIETYTLISTRHGAAGTKSTELAKEKSEKLVLELEEYLNDEIEGTSAT